MKLVSEAGAAQAPRASVPKHLRARLAPVARRVFWWGTPQEWLEDVIRFTAQVMTYGDLEDVNITLGALGEQAFKETLRNAPPGVFDVKSWTFWHVRFHLEVPPLPKRFENAPATL
jgi:hypothetical protein